MSISFASGLGAMRAALCAAPLAVLAACAMPSHPDSLAPTSDPFNPATIQLIDNTDWTLQNWRGGDGSVHALPSRPVTLSLSTRTGERHASGSAACNRYSGSYALKNGMLHFGPLASTFMACPSPFDGAFEHAYLDALGHIVNAGAQLSEPQALYLVTEDGATLTFTRTAP